jgi:hypothetical protein
MEYRDPPNPGREVAVPDATHRRTSPSKPRSRRTARPSTAPLAEKRTGMLPSVPVISVKCEKPQISGGLDSNLDSLSVNRLDDGAAFSPSASSQDGMEIYCVSRLFTISYFNFKDISLPILELL